MSCSNSSELAYAVRALADRVEALEQRLQAVQNARPLVSAQGASYAPAKHVYFS